MALGEVFPAVQVAEKTVNIAPTWWVAHQTLGRALVNVGEVGMVSYATNYSELLSCYLISNLV